MRVRLPPVEVVPDWVLIAIGLVAFAGRFFSWVCAVRGLLDFVGVWWLAALYGLLALLWVVRSSRRGQERGL